MPTNTLKIMVASTVYGFQDHIEQICAALMGYGYEVWNSHIRTIPLNAGISNLQNCLEAVRNCDAFFGGEVGDNPIISCQVKKKKALKSSS